MDIYEQPSIQVWVGIILFTQNNQKIVCWQSSSYVYKIDWSNLETFSSEFPFVFEYDVFEMHTCIYIMKAIIQFSIY